MPTTTTKIILIPAHFVTCNRLRSFLLRVSRTAPSNLMRSSGVCGLNLIVTCLNLYTRGNTIIQEPEKYNCKQTLHMKTCEKNIAVAGLQYGWLVMEFKISIWYCFDHLHDFIPTCRVPIN